MNLFKMLCVFTIRPHCQRLLGLVASFSDWVREVPSAISGAAIAPSDRTQPVNRHEAKMVFVHTYIVRCRTDVNSAIV